MKSISLHPSIPIPWESDLEIQGFHFGPSATSLSVVGGFHGNEVNGVLASVVLARALHSVEQHLQGGVRVITCVNPLAMDTSRRCWPLEEVDIYDSFRSGAPVTLTETIARSIADFVGTSRVVLDIHSSGLHLREEPHVRFFHRMDEGRGRLKTYESLAKTLGLAYCLKRDSVAGVDGNREVPGTSAGILIVHLDDIAVRDEIDVYPLVLTCGNALRANKRDVVRVIGAVARMLEHLGCIDTHERLLRVVVDLGLLDLLVPQEVVHGLWEPMPTSIIDSHQLELVRASRAGIFVSRLPLGDTANDRSRTLGSILSLEPGAPRCEFGAPTGRLVGLRLHPPVHEGEVVAKFLKV